MLVVTPKILEKPPRKLMEPKKQKPKKEEPKKKEPITIESIMAIGEDERKEIIEDAFKKGEIEEDMYREFGEWGWV